MHEVIPLFIVSTVVSMGESERPCQKQQPFPCARYKIEAIRHLLIDDHHTSL